MLSELIQSLAVASAGLFSVGSIMITILLLLSEKGKLKGLAYAVGYTLSYTLIGIAVIVFGIRSDNDSGEESSILFPVLSLVFGALLMFLAIRNWRKPKKKSERSRSAGFFASLDKMTPLKVGLTGVFVSIVNIKNLILFLSAISIVYASQYSLTFKLINVLLVALVFCFCVILPVIIAVVFPKQSMKFLQGIKSILETKSRTIGILLPLVFGLLFVINGILKLI